MQTMTPQTAQPAVPFSLSQRAGKYLIFNLGVEEFGTEVLKVREIMGLQDITAIHRFPHTSKASSTCAAK